MPVMLISANKSKRALRLSTLRASMHFNITLETTKDISTFPIRNAAESGQTCNVAAGTFWSDLAGRKGASLELLVHPFLVEGSQGRELGKDRAHIKNRVKHLSCKTVPQS